LPRLKGLDPATFVFWRPSIIDIPKGPNELIFAFSGADLNWDNVPER
jgi:hypothetical protein